MQKYMQSIFIYKMYLKLTIITQYYTKNSDCEKLSLQNQQNLEIEIFGYKEVILGQFIYTLY